MRVLVTGSNGFIGRAVCEALVCSRYELRRATRAKQLGENRDVVTLRDIGMQTDWREALDGVGAVIHLIGAAHSSQDLERCWQVNVEGTERLAMDAARAGVKRIVYLSSIKVNGEETTDTPFIESLAPNPQDAYGKSKLEAERRLFRIAEHEGLEVVVIRPPLVYGPGVKGNLLRLLRWIHKGYPVPVPAAENRRSLIGLENLTALIIKCIEHPNASGQVFLAADRDDLSTETLVRALAAGMRKSARLLRLPVGVVQPLATVLGGERAVRRLFGSLQVDCTKAHRLLDWEPVVPVPAGIEQMAAWFASAEAKR